MIRRLFRDPLAHFLLLGAALWLFLGWRGDDPDPASRSISVSRERQAALAVNFEQLMDRAPTAEELRGLIAGDVREEVLYREALRLGLDRDDPVIRRRLSKKMDELAAAEAESAEPGEADLRAWLARHPERFAESTQLSFTQRPFASEAAARAALAGGAGSETALDLPRTVSRLSAAEVRERFGIQFADELARLSPSPAWQGPLPSGLGWHLVRLEARDIGRVPPLAAIRQRVLDDWRSQTIADRRAAAYRLLESGYRLEIAR